MGRRPRVGQDQPEWKASAIAPNSTPSRGDAIIHSGVAEAFLLRAEVRFRRGAYLEARTDALEARNLSGKNSDPRFAENAEALAIRCDFALHGGGPGPDGKGVPMRPEELAYMKIESIDTQTLGIPESSESQGNHGSILSGVLSGGSYNILNS